MILGEHIHKPQSWLISVPRLTPTGTWVSQQGRRSKAVTRFLKRFAEDLELALALVGCPPANERRTLKAIRYGGRMLSADSLQQGGAVVESLLLESKLVSRRAGYSIDWRQAIDRSKPRTELHIQVQGAG